jgi:hypothetical protein
MVTRRDTRGKHACSSFQAFKSESAYSTVCPATSTFVISCAWHVGVKSRKRSGDVRVTKPDKVTKPTMPCSTLAFYQKWISGSVGNVQQRPIPRCDSADPFKPVHTRGRLDMVIDARVSSSIITDSLCSAFIHDRALRRERLSLRSDLPDDPLWSYPYALPQ